jgi:hypothetical protein
MPRLGGVYFLILDGKVIYVGKSINIVRRVDDHRKHHWSKGGTVFDYAVCIWEPREPAMKLLEDLLIATLKPPLNKVGKLHDAYMDEVLGQLEGRGILGEEDQTATAAMKEDRLTVVERELWRTKIKLQEAEEERRVLYSELHGERDKERYANS